MSIYRQFWLALIALIILTFTGSFAVSIYTARNYLEQQLYMKNTDNAGALALVLSQLPSKDPVMVDLVISAQFDTGHYQEIQLTDPTHHVLVDKRYAGDASGAPAWFEHAFPIKADPGIALVQDGWKQYGSIRLVSHSKFAYQALWNGVKELAIWFLFAGLAAGVLGTRLLKLLFQPLGRVVKQAEAIQERRFTTVDEPSTPELRSVVVAMNAMVQRLKKMFSEEAERLDALRKQVNHDQLTELPNRTAFMARLTEALQGEESPNSGALALVRINSLDELNKHIGHVRTDELIKAIADALVSVLGQETGFMAARLNGADFAILTGGDQDLIQFGDTVHDALLKALEPWSDLDDIFHLGVVGYRKGDTASDLLSQADKALAIAESKGVNFVHCLAESQSQKQTISANDWRQTLTNALSRGRIRLERYPVLASGGAALHLESSARLQLQPEGPWLPAGEFMPMALRLKLSTNVDMDALQIALDQLTHEANDIAVNLSADSITDWSFRDAMMSMLKNNPDRAKRLWLEIPEYGAFQHFEAFRSFCLNLSPLGCKLGIEHFGLHLSEISKLSELGLDYLKVDSQYVRDIAQNPGNQELLRGLCKVARNVGLLVIAEGVMTEEELNTLLELGFDGVTGQAVTQRSLA